MSRKSQFGYRFRNWG